MYFFLNQNKFAIKIITHVLIQTVILSLNQGFSTNLIDAFLLTKFKTDSFSNQLKEY